ncbi:protein kinase domain-containing protein [Mycobacterium sp. ML4]
MQGTHFGRWHYVAPERLMARDVDARADIYALTCVLYECLTGNRPFPGDSLESQVTAHLSLPPPRPSVARPDLLPDFDAVIAKGMAKEPGERYQTVTELAAAAQAAPAAPEAGASSAPTLAAAPAPGTVAAKPHTALPMTGLDGPEGVAVNGAGNVYVADLGDGQVTKLTAATGAQTTVPFFGLVKPWGVAVDGAGNVYVSDAGTGRVVRVAAETGSQSVLPFPGLDGPHGVAVDGAGNLFVAESGKNRVLKLPKA